jgi:hypothetical protein
MILCILVFDITKQKASKINKIHNLQKRLFFSSLLWFYYLLSRCCFHDLFPYYIHQLQNISHSMYEFSKIINKLIDNN